MTDIKTGISGCVAARSSCSTTHDHWVFFHTDKTLLAAPSLHMLHFSFEKIFTCSLRTVIPKDSNSKGHSFSGLLRSYRCHVHFPQKHEWSWRTKLLFVSLNGKSPMTNKIEMIKPKENWRCYLAQCPSSQLGLLLFACVRVGSLEVLGFLPPPKDIWLIGNSKVCRCESGGLFVSMRPPTPDELANCPGRNCAFAPRQWERLQDLRNRLQDKWWQKVDE